MQNMVHAADKEDAKRWDALPFHDEKDMSYCELGRRWRHLNNGDRIARLMLLNSHGRMPAQRKKAQ